MPFESQELDDIVSNPSSFGSLVSVENNSIYVKGIFGETPIFKKAENFGWTLHKDIYRNNAINVNIKKIPKARKIRKILENNILRFVFECIIPNDLSPSDFYEFDKNKTFGRTDETSFRFDANYIGDNCYETISDSSLAKAGIAKYNKTEGVIKGFWIFDNLQMFPCYSLNHFFKFFRQNGGRISIVDYLKAYKTEIKGDKVYSKNASKLLSACSLNHLPFNIDEESGEITSHYGSALNCIIAQIAKINLNIDLAMRANENVSVENITGTSLKNWISSQDIILDGLLSGDEEETKNILSTLVFYKNKAMYTSKPCFVFDMPRTILQINNKTLTLPTCRFTVPLYPSKEKICCYPTEKYCVPTKHCWHPHISSSEHTCCMPDINKTLIEMAALGEFDSCYYQLISFLQTFRKDEAFGDWKNVTNREILKSAELINNFYTLSEPKQIRYRGAKIGT